MPILETGFPKAAGLWRADIESAWGAVARIAAACARRLHRRRGPIYVSDVSEQWLAYHAAEAPKHAEDGTRFGG